jgi:hypothetical protein
MEKDITMPVLDTRANRELLLEFFLTFSRFEYALKASSFFQRPRQTRVDPRNPPDAKPNWDSFAVSLRGVFQSSRTDELQRACEFILDNPPWKQVILNDSVAWESPSRAEGEPEIDFLLRMIRTVRNNLFHGGKYNIEVHEDTHRTELLLTHSLTILKECLGLVPQVKRAFEEAVI